MSILLIRDHQGTYCHQEAAYADIWTQPLSHSSTFPEYPKHPARVSSAVSYLQSRTEASVPVLVAVHYPGHDRVRIGARADDQKDHQEQGLEVEEGRLGSLSVLLLSWAQRARRLLRQPVRRCLGSSLRRSPCPETETITHHLEPQAVSRSVESKSNQHNVVRNSLFRPRFCHARPTCPPAAQTTGDRVPVPVAVSRRLYLRGHRDPQIQLRLHPRLYATPAARVHLQGLRRPCARSARARHLRPVSPTSRE